MAREYPGTERGELQRKYNAARSNLLLMIIITVINIVLIFAESETMWLFSASIPYYAVIFGMMLDILPLGLFVAVVLIALYLVCYLMTKKRSGWFTVALVLFVLDTLALLGLYVLAEDFSGIFDMLMHAWILYYLIVGVTAGKKLKTMPEEEISDEICEETAEHDHSSPIRRIGEDEKCRVLLESEYGGRKVVYRRVKRTNQLVINDYIYDEIEMLVETGHYLYANIDGHRFEVGFDGASRSYFKVDDELVAKKIRWY